MILDRSNTLIGRAEWVQKTAEDLVLDGPPFSFAPDQTFSVAEMSAGYPAWSSGPHSRGSGRNG